MFVNKDAEFLDGLGETYIMDGDLETGLRLRQAARNLESLDERYRNVTAAGEFAAGVLEAHKRLIQKSNVPDLIVEPSMEAALKTFRGAVKKIPKGVSGIPLGESGLRKPTKSAKPTLNIKINLASLMK